MAHREIVLVIALLLAAISVGLGSHKKSSLQIIPEMPVVEVTEDQLNEDLFLTCLISSSTKNLTQSQVETQWKLPDGRTLTEIVSDPRFSVGIFSAPFSNNTLESDLLISRLTFDDAGFYTCMARFVQHSEFESAVVELKISGTPSPSSATPTTPTTTPTTATSQTPTMATSQTPTMATSQTPTTATSQTSQTIPTSSTQQTTPTSQTTPTPSLSDDPNSSGLSAHTVNLLMCILSVTVTLLMAVAA